MRTPIEAARPFFSFFTFFAIFMYWIYKSPNNIMEVDTRAVFLLTGTIFSNFSVSWKRKMKKTNKQTKHAESHNNDHCLLGVSRRHVMLFWFSFHLHKSLVYFIYTLKYSLNEFVNTNYLPWYFIYQIFSLFTFSLCWCSVTAVPLQCRLIVAQMSSTRCEGFHWMTPIYVATVIISMYVPFLERPLLYLLLIATSLCHWHYGTRVVSDRNSHNWSELSPKNSHSYSFHSGTTNVWSFWTRMLYCSAEESAKEWRQNKLNWKPSIFDWIL